MLWNLIFFAFGTFAWAVLFFVYIKPRWLLFRQAMGITAEAKAASPAVVALMGDDAPKLTIWQRIDLKIRGLKGTILAFFSWILLAGTQVLNALDPSTLSSVKDTGLWQALVGDQLAVKAVAGITFLIAFLSIRGQWHAARVVPSPPLPPTMNP